MKEISRVEKIRMWVIIVAVNVSVLLVLVMLQAMRYVSAPNLNYGQVDGLEKVKGQVYGFNQGLILLTGACTLVTMMLTYLILRKRFKTPVRASLIIGFVFLVLAGWNLTALSLNHIDRCMN